MPNEYQDTLYGPIARTLFEQMQNIRMLICDVDGVFSDGRIYLGNQGEELKAFHTRDGFGIKAIIRHNIDVAVITGRHSQIVESRMRQLTVPYIYQGQDDKLTAFEDLLLHSQITPEQCAYIGDDVVDLSVMNQVGLAISVSDAHPLVKRQSDYITTSSGGFGAVREVCDLLLQSRGLLDDYQGSSL